MEVVAAVKPEKNKQKLSRERSYKPRYGVYTLFYKQCKTTE